MGNVEQAKLALLFVKLRLHFSFTNGDHCKYGTQLCVEVHNTKQTVKLNQITLWYYLQDPRRRYSLQVVWITNTKVKQECTSAATQKWYGFHQHSGNENATKMKMQMYYYSL